jgi:hypothetical protein
MTQLRMYPAESGFKASAALALSGLVEGAAFKNVLAGLRPEGGQLPNSRRKDSAHTDRVPGYDLCPIIQEQAAGAGAEFAATEATGLHEEDGRWRVTTGEGDVRARAVVIATGTTWTCASKMKASWWRVVVRSDVWASTSAGIAQTRQMSRVKFTVGVAECLGIFLRPCVL